VERGAPGNSLGIYDFGFPIWIYDLDLYVRALFIVHLVNQRNQCRRSA
jgi:hypothetical protein